MAREYLVVVDDVPEVLSSLERKLRKIYQSRYEICGFGNARDALSQVAEIDERGDVLALVVTDEKMRGHELLRALTKTHPNARRVLYSSYTDRHALKVAVDQGVHTIAPGADPNEGQDGLYTVIDRQLGVLEGQPKIELELGPVVVRLADTLHEKRGLLECRYREYLRAGHFTEEDLTDEENESKQEWDEYDDSPNTRHVVAKTGGTIIGGGRIVDGALPIEECWIAETGKRFSLDGYRDQGIHTREIGRVVIGREHGASRAIAVTGLFMMISHLTRDHDYMWCGSREKQAKMYQAIGFEFMLDDEGEALVLEHPGLRGTWCPMVKSWTKTIEEPGTIKNFSPAFHALGTKQIEGVNIDEWIEFSRAHHALAEKADYCRCLYVMEE